MSRPSKKPLAISLAVLIVGTAALLAWLTWRHLVAQPISTDASLSADVIHMSASVPGTLHTLNIQEGSRVQAGDLLFTLDEHSYRLRVQQANAELAMAQAALTTRTRMMRAEQANAHIAQQQITRAQANLDLAQRTANRLRPLAAKGFAPQQEIDTAETAVRDARISLAQAQSQADAAQELIVELEAAQAAVQLAQATVALADKALADTQVYAPANGLVVGLTVSPGEHLAPDQSLFTLINTDVWYATAFYRETDLPHIQEGDCAVVYALMAPDETLTGRVASVGWGVISSDAIQLPRSMPLVQKSLNWVRVAQRFPVRVRLDNPPASLMRVGASATVMVRPGQGC
ncbi:multidrug transporter subunit MdtN [Castellaniella sp.]|uniref:multidrug transporter subunit MdtN n=1 Tax=Castellaniella sp. TaxID=1955812 RepID=UPI002AFDE85B|nr:multidrug transporter subunit MdtN [Castellaniella sp.]